MPVLTLHHLDYSRSTRVLWLLEELGLDYRLVRYARPVGGPAPAALRAVHPQGRSPVLVDAGFALAESSAILRYLDRHYGNSLFTPVGEPERARHDEWLDYVEGSLALPLFVPLAAGRDLPEQLRADLSAQLGRAWSFLEDALGARSYLLGEQLTLADIQLSYALAVASATGSLREDRPLHAYLGRLFARPALARALDAGGPMA